MRPRPSTINESVVVDKKGFNLESSRGFFLSLSPRLRCGIVREKTWQVSKLKPLNESSYEHWIKRFDNFTIKNAVAHVFTPHCVDVKRSICFGSDHGWASACAQKGQERQAGDRAYPDCS